MTDVMIVSGGRPRPVGPGWRQFVGPSGRAAVIRGSVIADLQHRAANNGGNEPYGWLFGRRWRDTRGDYVLVDHILFPQDCYVRATPTSVTLAPEGAAELGDRGQDLLATADHVGTGHGHPGEAFLSGVDVDQQRRAACEVTIVVSARSDVKTPLIVALGLDLEIAREKSPAGRLGAPEPVTVTPPRATEPITAVGPTPVVAGARRPGPRAIAGAAACIAVLAGAVVTTETNDRIGRLEETVAERRAPAEPDVRRQAPVPRAATAKEVRDLESRLRRLLSRVRELERTVRAPVSSPDVTADGAVP